MTFWLRRADARLFRLTKISAPEIQLRFWPGAPWRLANGLKFGGALRRPKYNTDSSARGPSLWCA
jgi:hypothetical protein